MPAYTPSPPVLLLALALPSPETARSQPYLPALEILARLLGCADATDASAEDLRSWVARQLGVSPPVPWAAAWQANMQADARTRLDDLGVKAGDRAPGDTLALLEPVQMVASMNSVTMRPLPSPLSPEQLQALVELLDPVFNADGGQLTAPGGRLLLRVTGGADWITTPLALCAGRDLRDCLPRGAQAGRLRRWMTECQMALHRHAEQGHSLLDGVNGVWAWGEGALVPAAAAPQARLFSQDPLLRALAAQRQQLEHGDALASLHGRPPAPLLLWQGGEDPAALFAVLRAARLALLRGNLGMLRFQLWLGDEASAAGWTLQRHQLLRFWRRRLAPWTTPPALPSPP